MRRISELESVDALIIPGGESTTIVSLSKTFGLFEPIKNRIAKGMPTYGSCAGMIMLADHIVAAKEGQETQHCGEDVLRFDTEKQNAGFAGGPVALGDSQNIAESADKSHEGGLHTFAGVERQFHAGTYRTH